MHAPSPFPRGAKVAIALCWCPLLGVLGAFLGMRHAFAAVATRGAPDSSGLAAAVTQVLWATLLGLSTSLAGLLLGLWYIIRKKLRSAWLVASCAFAGLVVTSFLVRVIWSFAHPVHD